MLHHPLSFVECIDMLGVFSLHLHFPDHDWSLQLCWVDPDIGDAFFGEKGQARL